MTDWLPWIARLALIAGDAAHLSARLTDFVSRVSGVRFVAVVTHDGRAIANAGELSSERIGDLAGVVAGIGGLFAGWNEAKWVGSITLTLIELDAGYLLLMSISDNLSCVVWADRAASVEDAAFELARLAGTLCGGSTFGRL